MLISCQSSKLHGNKGRTKKRGIQLAAQLQPREGPDQLTHRPRSRSWTPVRPLRCQNQYPGTGPRADKRAKIGGSFHTDRTQIRNQKIESTVIDEGRRRSRGRRAPDFVAARLDLTRQRLAVNQIPVDEKNPCHAIGSASRMPTAAASAKHRLLRCLCGNCRSEAQGRSAADVAFCNTRRSKRRIAGC